VNRYTLNWSNLGKVNELYRILRNETVTISDKKYLQLKQPGLYMFLDESKGIIDVGEANGKGRALRTRLRNEIYENSAFSKKITRFGMLRPEQLNLIVKCALVEEGIDYSALSPEEIDKQLKLLEKALICATDPWAYSHGGVKKWRQDEIMIVNHGDYSPLDSTMSIKVGKCLRKWN
jgi:hypothetical protein